MNVIKFGSDTKHRKQWFTGLSFSHPAKMTLPLQIWLIENFTKEGEIILDPMAGSGTVLVACSMGRDVICVELEQKFIEIIKGNWQKIQQRGCQMGYSMGKAQIIQGDARNLTGILVDKIITSPPYCEAKEGSGLNKRENWVKHLADINRDPNAISQITWTENRKGNNPDDLGNLPYGQIDKIISSPPYEGSDVSQTHMTSNDRGNPANPNYRPSWKRKLAEGYADTKRPYVDAVISSPPYQDRIVSGSKGRLGNHKEHGDLIKNIGYKYGYTDKVDSIITSPPYEGSMSGGGNGIDLSKTKRDGDIRHQSLGLLTYGSEYSKEKDNIGNLKSDSYLSAMLQVYQQCYAVLRPGGLMILVTKNFIRNKKQVRLDLDTIKLCEQAGFTFQERWYRELSSQSFWRTIYHQKYPDVEPIKFEDILLFIEG